tara:strand:- start:3200 stop:4012 length:813 start_codon:yes stop_codon:yes gene_type:complete
MNLNAEKQEKARQEKANKDAAFGAAKTAFYGKENQLEIAQNRNVIGYTKDISDAYATAVSTIGKGRARIEDATKAFLSSQKVNEGGRSTKFGRNKYLTLLQKTNEVESVIDTILGRNMAYVQEGARRKFSLANAEAREALGLVPQYGAPVMMPPSNRLGGALKIGTAVLGTAASIYSMGGLGAAAAGGSGPMSWFFGSDRKLKENIDEVGVSPDGYKIYEFSYKADKTHTRYRGAMAQDVVKINPMAVGIHPEGYLTVDYSKIDVDMEAV